MTKLNEKLLLDYSNDYLEERVEEEKEFLIEQGYDAEDAENIARSVSNEMLWTDMIYELGSIFLDKFPKRKVQVKGENLGWRKLSGECTLKFSSDRPEDVGNEVVRIFPKTDYTFQVYGDGKKVRINLYHHDAPTGEQYYFG